MVWSTYAVGFGFLPLIKRPVKPERREAKEGKVLGIWLKVLRGNDTSIVKYKWFMVLREH